MYFKMLRVPVIFIVFNRPDTTKEVFERIRAAQPKKLYIIADAPRENNLEDLEKCKKTRALVENVDWECEVKRKYATINLGCGINVSSGISWVFEQEEMAIILEDDCVPALPFFGFCQELLFRYKEDSRIMHIGGTNWHPEIKARNGESYFFSKDAHIWGWATWKRAWDLFDYDMSDYPEFISGKYYKDVISTKKEQKYFRTRWDSFYETNHQVQSRSNWDYQWYYTVLKNNGLCIWPSTNLVSNIGPLGTHSDSFDKKLFFKETDQKYTILTHPKFVIRNREIEEYHFLNFNYLSLPKRIYFYILKRLKNVVRSFI